MEMIHKWAETELREGLQIQKGNSVWIFPAERNTGKICLYGIKEKGRAENRQRTVHGNL